MPVAKFIVVDLARMGLKPEFPQVLRCLGYEGFFLSAMFLTLPGLVTLFFIPLDDGPQNSVSAAWGRYRICR